MESLQNAQYTDLDRQRYLLSYEQSFGFIQISPLVEASFHDAFSSG